MNVSNDGIFLLALWKSLLLICSRIFSGVGGMFSRLKVLNIVLTSISSLSSHILSSELWGYFLELIARCFVESHSIGIILSPVEKTILSLLNRKWQLMRVGLVDFGSLNKNLGCGMFMLFLVLCEGAPRVPGSQRGSQRDASFRLNSQL